MAARKHKSKQKNKQKHNQPANNGRVSKTRDVKAKPALKNKKNGQKPEKPKSKKDNKKKDMKKMSVEDFFNGGFDEDDSDDLDKELEALEQVQEEVDEDVSMDEEDEEPEHSKTHSASDDSKDEKEIENDVEEEPDSDVANEKDEDDRAEYEDQEEDEDEANEDAEIQGDSENSDADENDDEEEEEGEEEKEERERDSGKKLKKDIEEHKKALEELKDTDPEFYKFLQEEGKELLNFDESADDIDSEEEKEDNENAGSESEEDVDMEEASENESSDEEEDVSGAHLEESQSYSDLEVVNKTMVETWLQQLEKNHNVKALKKLLSAFKTAARMADDEQDANVTFTYRIVDPNVFNSVILGAMRHVPLAFNHHLRLSKSGKCPMTSSRWRPFQSMIKSYINNLLHLLKNLTDSDMLYLVVREAEKCSLYWACFERAAKEYIKVLLDLWSNFSSSDNVRIQSFLALRSLATAPVPPKLKSSHYLDLCLKNIYLTFVHNSKTTNVHTLPAINLMRNLAVQLYGIDQELSYQQAFVYIRQLAIHLRSAMQHMTKESHQTVYNWQYIHCIDFWSNVLAAHCQDEESPLRHLIYPLTQVALGAVRLIPTAQYFPLRFHVLRSMTTLGQATKVFIPLTPYLLEVLNSPEMAKQAKPSTLKPLDWDVHLRAPKQYLGGRVYQDGIFDQLYECTLNYYKGYFHHISFPEMVIPSIVAIKRFVKRTKNLKGGKKLHSLAAKFEVKSNFILTKRAAIDFSPSDEEKVKNFVDVMRQFLQ